MRPLVLLLLVAPPVVALPGDPFVWEVVEAPPSVAAAGLTLVATLEFVTGPLALPASYPVEAEDDAGGRIVADPPVIEAGPTKERHRVRITWEPLRSGARSLAVSAGGAVVAFSSEITPEVATVSLAPGNVTSAWRLPVRVATAAALVEPAESTWHLRYAAPEGTIAWSEPGPELATRGAADADLLLRYGPGRYALELRIVSPRVAGLSEPFLVDAAEASDPEGEAEVVAHVADDPLRIRLTSDTVNADGKTKRPGEPLLTRVRVEDANGLGGLARVEFVALRDGAVVAVEAAALPDDRWRRTALDLEHAFARSPLAAGAYVLRATARNATAEVAVERTFVIKLAKPDTGGLAIPNATLSDAEARLDGHANASGRSWERAAHGRLHLKVLKGTSSVAWDAELGNVTGPTPLLLPVAGSSAAASGERGLVAAGVTLRPPEGASGTFRVLLQWSANVTDPPVTLASSDVRVLRAPVISSIVADPAPPGGELVARLLVDPGEALDGVRLAFGNASAFLPGTGEARFAVPLGLPAGAPLRIEAEALALGRVAGRAAAETTVANAPPTVGLRASLDGVPMPRLRILPGVPHRVEAAVLAADANGDAPEVVALELRDLAGRVVGSATSLVPLEGGAVGVLDLPELPAGAYELVGVVRDGDGATAEARLSALVGRWAAVRVAVGALEGASGGLVGPVRVENAGNVPLVALAARLDGEGPLAAGGTLRCGALAGATIELGSPLLPGGVLECSIEVDLPSSPTPGSYEGRLRVLARPEAIP